MDKHNNCNCHEHSQCDHEHHSHHHDCDCEHHSKPKLVKMCILEDGVRCTNCGACDMCDLDPDKICDNCGKCLDTLQTDEKGFVKVPIDKIIMGENSDAELEQLLALYGLDDQDDED